MPRSLTVPFARLVAHLRARPSSASHRSRRSVALLLATVVLVGLSGCGPTLGNVGLRQPVSAPNVWDNSDPAVLVDGGLTYLYGSSNNRMVPVRVITDYRGSIAASQNEWAANPRSAMDARPAWVSSSDASIWAPTVRNMGGTYTMWFAAHRAGATDRSNDQCIGRAFARSPLGPFAPEANPFYCGRPAESGSNWWGRGALDPEVFQAADGRFYLLMALSRSEQSIGVVRLGLDGLPEGGINGAPSYLAGKQFPWHDGTDDSTFGPGGFLENPSMIYEPKSATYLLFYSAGDWYSARYLTGFARCATPMGPCTLDGRGPFLTAGSGRSGAGGLTVFDDQQGSLRVAYATWTAGHEAPASNPTGAWSRQVTFSILDVSGTDPASQSITLR
jgi:hypothetical protein